MSKTVDALNAAFHADPNAICALMLNRVPCNQELADDPFMVVEEALVQGSENFQLGALGMLNGVLSANGLPSVAGMWRKHENGTSRLIGFCEYKRGWGNTDESEVILDDA